MTTLIATRSELLARRSEEAIARRGHTLLTQKRAALIAELRRLGLEVANKRAELERIAATARQALGWAVVADGPQAVASAAIAAAGTVPAAVTSRNVAGVRVVGLAAGPAARARAQEPVPAGDAMAAIQRAEEAAAARLAAEAADQAGRDEARRRAAALLEEAATCAAELARQRREVVAAEARAEAERERAAAAAAARRLRRAAGERHDLAVELAVTYVLTGEYRCSSR